LPFLQLPIDARHHIPVQLQRRTERSAPGRHRRERNQAAQPTIGRAIAVAHHQSEIGRQQLWLVLEHLDAPAALAQGLQLLQVRPVLRQPNQRGR